MPRPPRIHVPGGIYHVMLRGNHRRLIFFGDADRQHFSMLVAEIAERLELRIHAFCWMSNHIHIAVQVGDRPLGEAVQRIASRHARRVQRDIPTTGHLFERRYRANLVADDSYLLQLIRYIHLNPVQAGVVSDPADYRWSSHRAYLGLEPVPWLTTEFTLRMLAESPIVARQGFADFVGRNVDSADEFDSDALFSDEAMRSRGNDRVGTTTTAGSRGPERLDELIALVCARHDLPPERLAEPGRGRVCARARAVVVWEATRSRLASLSELAERFRRSPSTLCESVELYRRAAPELFSDGLDGK